MPRWPGGCSVTKAGAVCASGRAYARVGVSGRVWGALERVSGDWPRQSRDRSEIATRLDGWSMNVVTKRIIALGLAAALSGCTYPDGRPDNTANGALIGG